MTSVSLGYAKFEPLSQNTTASRIQTMQIFHRKFYRKTGESKSFLLAMFAICMASAFSCSTNFNVNAPYKEENAVYGLLEIHDNAQIIKIGKVFQNGPGVTAAQAAQQMDSLYQSDSLLVTLTDNNTGASTRLNKFYNTLKEPGYFASPGQYLYTTPAGFALNPADNYGITIYDTKTKTQSSAATNIVNDISPIRPYQGSQVSISNVTGLYEVNFGAGANAATYDVNMYIPIHEYKKSDSTLIKTDTLVFNILSTYPVTGAATNIAKYFQNIQFYQFVGASLKVDPTVFRKMDSLDFEITGAATDLANYVAVNQPQAGIVQNKPNYTNITNGVGIFSSRLITHIKAPLTLASFDLLNTSQYTVGLNFVK